MADSVAEGVIPQSEADDLFICVGVFIHWDASDNKKIEEFNYRADEKVDRPGRAWRAECCRGCTLRRRNEVKRPFAA